MFFRVATPPGERLAKTRKFRVNGVVVAGQFGPSPTASHEVSSNGGRSRLVRARARAARQRGRS